MTKTYINIIILAVLPSILKAHQDQYFISKFKNIEIRIKSAWDCEEVKKSKIIGEYCSNLAMELNYKEKIFIDLIHDYGKSMTAASFIAFNNGEYKYIWQNEASIISRKKKRKDRDRRIVIRQIKYTFTISEILNQVEYAIQNLETIKSSSQEISHKGYLEDMEYYFETIPQKSIINISNSKPSRNIKKILKQRIFRHEEEEFFKLSYFSQHGIFYLFYDETEMIQIVDSVINIYSLNRVNSQVSFIFTSPKEFICISRDHIEPKYQVSRKHTIESVNNNYYRSIEVNLLNKGIYSIYHNKYGISNHSVFYIENEKLISDFHKVLKELKN